MEAEFLDWLRSELSSPAARGLRDDAAVLDTPARVVTTDLLLDGVHFRLEQCGPQRAGRKSLAASLSDLAAMGAAPRAAVVSLALPRHRAGAAAREILGGMLPLAQRQQLEIVGGDTNTWDGPLAINVAAWGDPVGEPLSRSGGQVGDRLLVTGRLGGSLLGRHLNFPPRVAEALWLMEHATPHAAMDLSDGLSADLPRLTEASGCGAVVRAELVPVSDDAVRIARRSGRPPLQHALHDGEDFELLLSMSPAAAERAVAEMPVALGTSVTVIGELVQSGVWLEQDGRRQPLISEGFIHREAAP